MTDPREIARSHDRRSVLMRELLEALAEEPHAAPTAQRTRYPRAPMAPDEGFEMESCRACRGSGRVISNLGGSPKEVDCPWCEGSGKFPGPDHDAQAHWGPPESAVDG